MVVDGDVVIVMPSTRNGWSSSSYEKSSVGNRVGRYLIKQPSDEKP
jgi:hypothetical protein